MRSHAEQSAHMRHAELRAPAEGHGERTGESASVEQGYTHPPFVRDKRHDTHGEVRGNSQLEWMARLDKRDVANSGDRLPLAGIAVAGHTDHERGHKCVLASHCVHDHGSGYCALRSSRAVAEFRAMDD